MVHLVVDHLANGSQSLDAVDVDLLQEIGNQSELLFHLIDECSQELNEVWIVKVDAKIEAVKKSERILLDIVTVFTDNIDDLLIELILSILLLLDQSIRLFKSVKSLMMKVDFLSELRQVVLLYLVVHVILDLRL